MNLIVNICLQISTYKNYSLLTLLNLLNIIVLFLVSTFLLTIYLVEFLNNQKYNGTKSIELKNGCKPWQLFWAKILAVFSTIELLTFIFVIEIIIINISFNGSLVTNMFILSAFSSLLNNFIFLGFAGIVVSLFNSRVSLTLCGFLICLLDIFPLIGETIPDIQNNQDKKTYAVNNEYRKLTSFDKTFQTYKLHILENKYPNSLLSALFEEANIIYEERSNLVYSDSNSIKDCKKDSMESDLCQKYFENKKNFLVDAIESGYLQDYLMVENNKNKYFANIREEDYYELKYCVEFIQKFPVTYKTLQFLQTNKFDKNENNIFLDEPTNNDLKKGKKNLKEYTKYLENKIKQSNYNNYLKEIKEINKLINNFYIKYGLLYKNILRVSRYEPKTEIDLKYFDGQRVYQKLLFSLLINDQLIKNNDIYRNNLELAVNNHNDYNLSSIKIFYYATPWGWMEFMQLFISVHSLENKLIVNDLYILSVPNFAGIDLQISEDNQVEKIDLYYTGVNKVIIYSLIIIISISLVSGAWIIFEKKFYKD